MKENYGNIVTPFPLKGQELTFEFLRDVSLDYLNRTLKPEVPYVCEWVPADGRCCYHALYVMYKLYNLKSHYIRDPTSSENLKQKLLKYIYISL